MNSEQLYLKSITPLLNEFGRCSINSYEVKQVEQIIAEEVNVANIHRALDIPDFKWVKDKKMEGHILKIATKKLNLGKEVKFSTKASYPIFHIDGVNYQLVFFKMGTLPKVQMKSPRMIFFMYQNGFQKIFYCGQLNLGSSNTDRLNDEHLEIFKNDYCEKGTAYFTNFEKLTR